MDVDEGTNCVLVPNASSRRSNLMRGPFQTIRPAVFLLHWEIGPLFRRGTFLFHSLVSNRYWSLCCVLDWIFDSALVPGRDWERHQFSFETSGPVVLRRKKRKSSEGVDKSPCTSSFERQLDVLSRCWSLPSLSERILFILIFLISYHSPQLYLFKQFNVFKYIVIYF